MKALTGPLRESEPFRRILDALQKGLTPVEVTGCVVSQEAHLIAALDNTAPCRLVVTHTEEKAKKIYEDLTFFEEETMLYPSRDILFYSADVHGNEIARQRIGILKRLMDGEQLTLVTCLDALLEKMVPFQEFDSQCLLIDHSSVVDTGALRIKLTEMGYENTGMVEVPGEYGIRGDIIDLYPLTEDHPVRIELWGDEVDSIRSFNPETQRSIQNLSQVRIYPASEILLKKDRIQEGIRRMEEECQRQAELFKRAKKRKERDRIRKMVQRTEEELRELGRAAGSEGLLPYFYEQAADLMDYLPDGTLYILDEPQRLLEMGRAYEEAFVSSMENRIEGGYILPGQADLIFGCEEILERLKGERLILLSTLIQGNAFFAPRTSVEMHVRSIISYNNSFDQLIQDLKKIKKKDYRILLLSPSATRARRLAEDIRYNEMDAVFTADLEKDLVPGMVTVAQGRLTGGFEYPGIGLMVISEKDIFKERRRRRKKAGSGYSGEKIQSLSEIALGDYVVHENYGLGVYQGMEKIESNGVARDYINIEYRDSSNLFIPASQLEKIQKYTGVSGRPPKLNKLGGNEWEKTKSKVRSQVQIAARDLVDLYAQRQSRTGYVYGPDTIWQTEFEEMFPYEETEDQLAAINDTKRDMESDRIMDRLICGDVGYGKTEVALRAAFKAVQESLQVVYLVPTTILAQQHYNSFKERMENYPVEIGMLSRFCSPSEEKRIKKGLADGSMDIVIGTHKVLSKSVKYKKLGLLIIDEEQRFGVRQKEKIKQLKKDVDVLALSATPIPRTLHMSMAGIRDMSVLEVPPVDRRAIQTYVMEYNEELVREAVARELARGGQVYYVYNRVSTIPDVAARIQELLPEAVVEYAHGRMGERQLEQIMKDFMSGEIDVLVSTTIIETGLDIPNVNTIIIEDSQRYGLAQLYQLRGRVGRSSRTAYAFLMYKRDSILKEQAEKRLKAIREFTDLGSGFKIAMRDLEIRGAGNLLGAEQSGHMEAVGYDMYCKMLNEAVLAMKGVTRKEDAFDTAIDLQLDAYIPEDYIPDETEKLSWYKRVALVKSQEDYEDMTEELTDRYGDVPAPLLRLLQVALLREDAHRSWLLSVEQKGDDLLFTMNNMAEVQVEKIDAFLKQYHNHMKVKVEKNPVFVYHDEKLLKKDIIDKVKEIVLKIRTLLETKPE